MAAKESELSLLHSLLTNVFTLDCKTCIDEGIPMAASDKLAIAKFLKDNAITCEPDADDMEELRKAFESGKDLRRHSWSHGLTEGDLKMTNVTLEHH